MSDWLSRKVQIGSQENRKIGYPTLNLQVGDFWKTNTAGLYRCEVRIGDQHHQGALYFGPRLGTGEMILEIYVNDFDREIYGEMVRFRIMEKMRDAKTFRDMGGVKVQMKKDMEAVKTETPAASV